MYGNPYFQAVKKLADSVLESGRPLNGDTLDRGFPGTSLVSQTNSQSQRWVYRERIE